MIIGKPITIGGSGLKPQLIVTAPAGSTLDILQNSVIIKTYTLGASETSHTFEVSGLGTYTARAALGTQTRSTTVTVDEIAQYSVTINYKLYLIKDSAICDGYTFTGVINSAASASSYYGGGEAVSSSSYAVRSATIGTTVRLDNYKNNTTVNGCGSNACAYCTTPIDYTDYSALKCNFTYYSNLSQIVSSYGGQNCDLGTCVDTSCNSTRTMANSESYRYIETTTTTTGIYQGTLNYERDISSFTGENLVILYLYRWGVCKTPTNYVTINDLWLEI